MTSSWLPLLLLPVSYGFAQSVTAPPSSPTHFQHTECTRSEPTRIWALWTDVGQWPAWDSGLKAARLDSPFGEGASGLLTPDRGPRARFWIEEVEPGRAYTLRTRLPLGSLTVRRSLVEQDGITCFTHDVQFRGVLRGLFGRLLGRRYRQQLPAVMQTIRQLAEQH